MLKLITKTIAHLPLKSVHRLGAFLGQLLHKLSSKTAKLRFDNLKQTGIFTNSGDLKHCLEKNIKETGKAALETFFIWGKNSKEIEALVRKANHWECIETALAKGKGIIFLTPHMGCFEITSRYYALYYPITVLYRAPKQQWLTPLIIEGRAQNNITLAEANASGVRKLMQALKRGEAIGILPDQIPAEGEGEWADFFGRPAYTMTLASKLAEKTGATVIMAFGERLPNGQGYELHLTKVDSIATPALLNQAIERQIIQKPSQYLWQYNRYKARRHALQKTNAPNA
jgi:Kdo2-lipid IVA lauroyltransferase/acyltransferase